MKRLIQFLLCLLMACSLASCAEPTYRYHLISFEQSAGKVLTQGIGRPDVCKALFEEPGIYLGPHISIPKDASVLGTLVVTRNEELKAIPLYTWQDAAGSTNFGCNGPSPAFANHAKTQQELVASLTKVISRPDSGNPPPNKKGTKP